MNLNNAMWPKQGQDKPFAHEATIAISSTALALKAEKWGTMTIGGDVNGTDGAAQTSAWSLSGVNRSNTYLNNEGFLTLYWKLTDATGDRTVDLYKTPKMAAGDKVATGTRTGDGAITLAAANSSGITGTVTVAYIANDTDDANTVKIAPRATSAIVTIEVNSVRYWMDNTVPTTTDGHLAYASATAVTEILLATPEAIQNFRFIAAASDGKYSVTYFE